MPDIDQTSPWPALPVSALLQPRRLVVPLLGAGISVDAGLPDGPGLALWITEHELAAGVDFSSLPPSGYRRSPLHVSEVVRQQRPAVSERLRLAVRDHLDDLCKNATLTPLLRHLAKTPGRLIITLNYDDLVERAAEDDKVRVRSMTRDDLDALIAQPGLPGPDDPLHVVHLHGSVRRPEMFVVDMAGYARVRNDAAVGHLFAALMTNAAFVCLGPASRNRTSRGSLNSGAEPVLQGT